MIDISWFELSISYVFLLIPYILIRKYKIGLTKDLFISIARMTLQLLFVGVYLEVIFRLNYWWLNVLWLIIMFVVTSSTVLSRTKLKKSFFLPIFFSVLISVFLFLGFVVVFVLKLDNFFDAPYIIPIAGMLIGNCLSDLVVSLNTFINNINKQQNTYYFAIANGASQKEALEPFYRSALKIKYNQSLAAMAVIGLVSLPGMMTGQILGGSTPEVAIKYQLLIMLTIFTTTSLSNFLALKFICKKLINDYNCIK